jgi:hypothetical protein
MEISFSYYFQGFSTATKRLQPSFNCEIKGITQLIIAKGIYLTEFSKKVKNY